MRRPLRFSLKPALRLAGAVLVDVVQSNFSVARIILGARRRGRVSGFVDIPLELHSAGGLAVLACIITATPGTAWAQLDSGRGVLTIHVLDLDDRDGLIRTIKERYEKRLLEIFG